jgi:hypothetical protein
VFGYLAGVAETTNLDPMRGLDANAAEAWISNYCQAHPLNSIIDGARAFIREHPR